MFWCKIIDRTHVNWRVSFSDRRIYSRLNHQRRVSISLCLRMALYHIQRIQKKSLIIACFARIRTRYSTDWFILITWVSQMKALNTWTILCAGPWLTPRCAAISFTVTRRFSFTTASTAAMPSGVTTGCACPGLAESVTELMPFMNFLVHSYTCCNDRRASPYWTFIRRWFSMVFTPSLFKKRMTERCSSLVHVASGAAIFTLLLRRRVAFLCRTTPCRPLFKSWVLLFSAYKTIKLCFEFLLQF